MHPERPIQQCPHCKLPLTRQESCEEMCPVCHQPLYDIESNPDDLPDAHSAADDSAAEDTPAEPSGQVEEPQETQKRTGLVIAIASVAVLLITGVVLTSVFSSARDDQGRPERNKKDVAFAPAIEGKPDAPPIDAERPADKPADKPVAVDLPDPDPEDRRDIPDLVVDIPPDQELQDLAEEVDIDKPNGEHAVAAVTGVDSVKLGGKVKKLTIAGVHGQGVLTSEKLTARDVIVTGAVNEAGTLKLDVPGGSVTFLSSLDGAARVRINAPGGKVTFGSVDKSVHGGGAIVGSAHVTVIARDVDLRGAIDGGARVVVTLTEGGSLRFKSISGGAHVHYRKAKPGDPAPKIDRGRVTAGGKFARLDPPPEPKAPAKSPRIELDLTKLDANGLRGPAGGKVLVAYEFCIPNTAECKAEVKAIDKSVRFMPGSRGRIGAGKDECLCIGETGPNYKTVLERLGALPYIKRIIECHWE
jgi:uncharacterized Zn finger protein (UPF0148 family)